MTEHPNPLIGKPLPPPTTKPPRSWLLLAGMVAITLVLAYRSVHDGHQEPAGNTHTHDQGMPVLGTLAGG